MRILVSSRSQAALQAILGRISRCGSYESEGVLVANGSTDPLMGVDFRPDVVVLHADDHLVEELRALADRRSRDRPALVVVGDHLPTEAMKYALRAGVRDIIGEQDGEDLEASLGRLNAELCASDDEGGSRTIVVVNAKGGSGGTFVATNLAYLSVTAGGDKTIVMDLDFQYGALPHYLDLDPKRGLLEALAHAHELDEMAVEAYAVKHRSGLHVMAPLPESQAPADFNIADRMIALLEVLKRRYHRVIIDLPRHLDEAASRTLQASDEIVVVLQQSLLSIHDAVRLKSILLRELGIPEARITWVVNRYSKRSTLDVSDIQRALDDDDPALVPNHYKLVAESLDSGMPLVEQAPSSGVAKALVALQSRVMGSNAPVNRGFLAKTVLRLRG